jgi:hypothetical protein
MTQTGSDWKLTRNAIHPKLGALFERRAYSCTEKHRLARQTQYGWSFDMKKYRMPFLVVAIAIAILAILT